MSTKPEQERELKLVKMELGPNSELCTSYKMGDVLFAVVAGPGRIEDLPTHAMTKAREVWEAEQRVEQVFLLNTHEIIPGLKVPGSVIVKPIFGETSDDSDAGVVSAVVRHFAKLFSADELCMIAESWVVTTKSRVRDFEGPVRLQPDRRSVVTLLHEHPKRHPQPRMWSAPIDDASQTLGVWSDPGTAAGGNYAYLLPPSTYPQQGGKV